MWGGTGAVQLDPNVADYEQVPSLSGAWGCAVQLPVMYQEMQRMMKGSYVLLHPALLRPPRAVAESGP